MAKADLRAETVSIGQEPLGRIRQTDRGFEIFDASDVYLFTEVSLAAARRALFQRHKDGQEANA